MLEKLRIGFNNQILANRILRFLATQPTGEISQNNLANYFNTAISNVNNVLDILEKTHLIFHCEPYGEHQLELVNLGNTIMNLTEYEGILIENQIATNLFNLSVKEFSPIFNLF